MTVEPEPMDDRIIDQRYLKEGQYRTPDNLQARITLHRLFGTSQLSWQRWVFENLRIAAGMRILEAGCGPGELWSHNWVDIPQGVRLYLGDLSAGMVRAALANIAQALAGAETICLNYDGFCLDVQHIPYPDGYFDLVIANHMLYHVPNLDQAIAEMRRVVRPDGRVVTATNGLGHMRQLGELVEGQIPGYRFGHFSQVRRYALENASDALSKCFTQAEVKTFSDDLHVTQVEPLLAYIASLWDQVQPQLSQVQKKIARQVQDEIDQHGYFLINKSQGILIADP